MQHRLSAAGTALTLILALPAGSFASLGVKPDPVFAPAAPVQAEVAADITPYSGIATWVDMFDAGPYKQPGVTVDRMAALGVKTLYLETSNWKKKKDVYRPKAVAKMLDRAHSHGINVVAWYVPAFSNLKKDFRRVKAALDFRTSRGNEFDSFALDIEATEVRDIPTRNKRMLRLSRRIRDRVGIGYSLGAIIPDPAGQVYWPNFPYAKVGKHYDVFLPMGYYTYRVNGAKKVYTYSRKNISIIREETGDPTVPVHPIGGIAGRASRKEVQAFIDASLDEGAFGISLYDYPLTTTWEWRKLGRVVLP